MHLIASAKPQAIIAKTCGAAMATLSWRIGYKEYRGSGVQHLCIWSQCAQVKAPHLCTRRQHWKKPTGCSYNDLDAHNAGVYIRATANDNASFTSTSIADRNAGTYPLAPVGACSEPAEHSESLDTISLELQVRNVRYFFFLRDALQELPDVFISPVEKLLSARLANIGEQRGIETGIDGT